jgi:hypothetical protein
MFKKLASLFLLMVLLTLFLYSEETDLIKQKLKAKDAENKTNPNKSISIYSP